MARHISRRLFLSAAGSAAVLGGCGNRAARTLTRAPGMVLVRPEIPYGLASGDVTDSSAVVWSRCDRPARMEVEWATVESMKDATRVHGPDVGDVSDYTGKMDLSGLPAGQRIFYRVKFVDLFDPVRESEPVVGTFKTAPLAEIGPRDVTFAWSGDVAGQGWGIETSGGMRAFETMRGKAPDFFIHSGDSIYADNVIEKEVKLDDGTIWKNLVTPEKSKVAETLAEFRGNYKYNLMDAHVRAFNAAVPMLVQWDDHEVRNNWSPAQAFEDARYAVKDVDLLAARGRQAFVEYMPIRVGRSGEAGIYRSFKYGPLLEVFMLDMRSFKSRNSLNRQVTLGAESRVLGEAQVKWLKDALLKSKATWKVIANDLPLSHNVGDTGGRFEAVANNEKGAPLGRELEIADLLRFMKESRIRNTVWVTADVHYATSIHYDPQRAAFKDFDPFWEFVSGPLHAGTFRPGALDGTFGPAAQWISVPRGLKGNRPPSEGLQFFGMVRIDGKSRAMSVTQHDASGRALHQVDLEPVL